jgi:hypothetical protein
LEAALDIIREIQHEVMKQQLNGKNNMPPKKADTLAVCTESDGKPYRLFRPQNHI